MMKIKGSHWPEKTRLKPIVSAVALMLASGVYAAEETAETLPEVQVKDTAAIKEDTYNPTHSANQKFVVPLKDTPKTVTVITEEIIKDTGSVTFQDALRTTPGITFGSGEGGIAIGDRPFIRGFDVLNSIFVDGLRDIGAQNREVFAIEQLEVIKGPSGAYDGRGSAGGSINIVTKQARGGNFTAGAISGGTDNFMRGTVDGNFMLGDNAAFRIVGMAHKADIPGRDHVEVERHGIMPSLTLGLNSPTSVRMNWYHLKSDDIPDWGLPFIQEADGIPQGEPIGVSKDTFYGLKDRDFMETQADIGTVLFSHAFSDDVILRNTTRYGVTTNDWFVTRPNVNGAQLAANQVQRNNRSRGTETTTVANLTDLTIKFDTGWVRHNLNTGIELSREENVNRAYAAQPATLTSATDPNTRDPSPPVVRNRFDNFDAETVNRSVYVFDSMDLSDRWLLNAGIRYDSYRSSIRNMNPNTGAVTGGGEFENDKSFFNYQLGAVYRLLPNANVYATYATSSSPVGLALGDFNYTGTTLDADSEDLDPERSRTYEIGTKWDVLEDLSLTAALFHTTKVNARVNVGGGGVSNAGEIESKGFEIGAAGKVTNKWLVFGGYTYVDARQTEVGNVIDPLTPGGAGNKGNQVHGIAKNSASIWTTYRILPKLNIGGGAFYMDKVFADPGNNGFVPSYVRWDAMANYKINKNLDLQLNIQNLTDERYFSATYFRHYAIVAPGRSAFATLNFYY